MNSTPLEERRLNPQVYNSVNRDPDRLFTSHLADLLRTMEIPRTSDPRGNPHPPQSVIGALVLKIYYSTGYDEIEARLRGMKELYCKTFDVDRTRDSLRSEKTTMNDSLIRTEAIDNYSTKHTQQKLLKGV